MDPVTDVPTVSLDLLAHRDGDVVSDDSASPRRSLGPVPSPSRWACPRISLSFADPGASVAPEVVQGTGTEIQPACVEASVSLGERYAALFREEHDERLIAEEKLHELQLSLRQVRLEQQAMEDDFDRERAMLLQRVREKEHALNAARARWAAQLDEERLSTQREEERLRQRLRQDTLCQRKLSKDMSSLRLERDALNEEVCRIGSPRSRQLIAVGGVPTPQRNRATAASARTATHGSHKRSASSDVGCVRAEPMYTAGLDDERAAPTEDDVQSASGVAGRSCPSVAHSTAAVLTRTSSTQWSSDNDAKTVAAHGTGEGMPELPDSYAPFGTDLLCAQDRNSRSSCESQSAKHDGPELDAYVRHMQAYARRIQTA